MYYKLKKTFDGNGIQDGWRVMGKSLSDGKLRGDIYKTIKGDDYEFFKVTWDVDFEPVISEDLTTKKERVAGKARDKGIVADTMGIFGSASISTLLADTAEYMLRIVAPESFINANLKAEVETITFTIGDDLDTGVKIKMYHLQVLLQISALRNQRKADYKEAIK